MDFTVTMSDQEYLEFLKWKKAKRVNSLVCTQYFRQLQALATHVLLTVVDCGQGDSPEYRISSQGCAEDLCALAKDVLA